MFRKYKNKKSGEILEALRLPNEKKPRDKLLQRLHAVLLDEGDFIVKNIGGRALYTYSEEKFNEHFEEMKDNGK